MERVFRRAPKTLTDQIWEYSPVRWTTWNKERPYEMIVVDELYWIKENGTMIFTN